MRLREALSQREKRRNSPPQLQNTCVKSHSARRKHNHVKNLAPAWVTVDNACQNAKCCSPSALGRGNGEKSLLVVSLGGQSLMVSLRSVVLQADFGDNHSEAPPPLLATHLHEELGDGYGGGKGKTLHVEPGGTCQTGVCPEQAENEDHGTRTFVHSYSYLISPPTWSTSYFCMRGRG